MVNAEEKEEEEVEVETVKKVKLSDLEDHAEPPPEPAPVISAHPPRPERTREEEYFFDLPINK